MLEVEQIPAFPALLQAQSTFELCSSADSQIAPDRALTTLCGLRDFATLFANRSDSSEFCWSKNRVFC